MGAWHRPTAHGLASRRRAVGVAGGPPQGCLVTWPGMSGIRRSPSPGCPSLGRAIGIRCAHAVGAGVQAWAPGTGRLACVPCWTLHAAGLVGGCLGGGFSRRCEGRRNHEIRSLC